MTLKATCVCCLFLWQILFKDKFLLCDDDPRLRSLLQALTQDRQAKLSKEAEEPPKSTKNANWTGLHMSIAEKRSLDADAFNRAKNLGSTSLFSLLFACV